jgi:hypothetical protein
VELKIVYTGIHLDTILGTVILLGRSLVILLSSEILESVTLITPFGSASVIVKDVVEYVRLGHVHFLLVILSHVVNVDYNKNEQLNISESIRLRMSNILNVYSRI